MIFLQAGKSASPLHAPVLQQDISLYVVLAIAALNPAAIVVAYLMGRRATNGVQLSIAAFAGAIAGIAALWLAARFHFDWATSSARAASGIFVLSFVFCFLWAWLGQKSRMR